MHPIFQPHGLFTFKNGLAGIQARGVMAAPMLLLVLLLVFQTGALAADPQVSGRLENGLRVIDARTLGDAPDLTVFRGDYIRFDGGGAVCFKVPDLMIEKCLDPDISPSPYFKMKQAGRYGYTLGGIQGTIQVIEFQGVHYQALTADQAQKVMAEISPLLLDVRTPKEYAAARIQGAVLIPVQQLSQRLSELEPYKGEPILIYCATGNRSTVAAKILIDNGFTRIFNLRYGIVDWHRRKHPVVQ